MTEVSSLQEQLDDGVGALGLNLSPVQLSQLLAYLALLDKWNRVYNLTAVRETERMVSHHLLDSLAIVPYLPIEAAATHPNPLPKGEGANAGLRPPTAIDVGSGGGLPGIPLAIARPDLQITLIDSVAKKTAFLLQVKAELGLDNVTVVTGRVETYSLPLPSPPPHAGEGVNAKLKTAQGFNNITSRAFSDLKEFVTLTRHLLAPGGRWLAMKGLYPHEEIAALPDWVKVSANPVLSIPHLDATRHLIILEPAS